jgi:hypothetical protein
MIFALTVALAAATAPAAPAPANTVVAQKPRLLLLDFKDDGVGENAVHIIHDSLASHLSEDARLEVISTEDMRRALDMDAQKRAISNCSDDACQAEIAEALGAQLTMFGTAGKLGDLVVVNVSLYDARQAKSLGRKTIEVRALDELPPKMREAGDELVAKVPGLATAAAASLPLLTYGGGVIAGAGLVVAGVCGLVWLVDLAAVKKDAAFADKKRDQEAADDFAAAAVVGLGVAVVGGAIMGAGVLVE